jgi:hypothetical protein
MLRSCIGNKKSCEEQESFSGFIIQDFADHLNSKISWTARKLKFKIISQRGIPFAGFPDNLRKRSQKLTTIFKTTETKNPITSSREVSPGFTGCLYHRIPIASRKHILQMKAERWSILKKAIVQKSKYLLKIALFCLINQFQ